MAINYGKLIRDDIKYGRVKYQPGVATTNKTPTQYTAANMAAYREEEELKKAEAARQKAIADRRMALEAQAAVPQQTAPFPEDAANARPSGGGWGVGMALPKWSDVAEPGYGKWLAQKAAAGVTGFGAGVVDAAAAVAGKEIHSRGSVAEAAIPPKMANPLSSINKKDGILQNIFNVLAQGVENLDFVQYINNPVTYGAVNAAKKLLLNAAFNDLSAKVTGNESGDEMAKKVTDTLYSVTAPQHEWQRKLEAEGAKFSDTKRMVGDVAQAVTNMLPSIGLSVATGNPAVGLAALGTSAGGAGAQEAHSAGADPSQSFKAGVLKGGLEVGTEMMFGGIAALGKGVFGSTAEKFAGKFVNSSFGKVAMKLLDVGGEGVEEGISALLDSYIDRAVYDSEAERATIQEIGRDALMGVVVSALMGGGAAAVNAATRGRGRSAQAANTEAPTVQPQPMPKYAGQAAPMVDGATQVSPQAPAQVTPQNTQPADALTDTESNFGSMDAPTPASPVRSALASAPVQEAHSAQGTKTATMRTVISENNIGAYSYEGGQDAILLPHVANTFADLLVQNPEASLTETIEQWIAPFESDYNTAYDDLVRRRQRGTAKEKLELDIRNGGGEYLDAKTAASLSVLRPMLRQAQELEAQGRVLGITPDENGNYTVQYEPPVQEVAPPVMSAEETEIRKSAEEFIRRAMPDASQDDVADFINRAVERRMAELAPTPEEAPDYAFMKSVSEKSGAIVRVAEVNPNEWVPLSPAEGMYNPKTNTITFTPQASRGDIARGVAMHELTHVAEASPAYGEYSAYVADRLFRGDSAAQNTAIANKRAEYATAGVTLDADAAMREIVADYTRNKLFKDAESVNRFVAEKPGIARRVLDWIRRALEKVRLWAADKDAYHALRDLEHGRRLFERALDSARTQRDGPAQFALSDADFDRMYNEYLKEYGAIKPGMQPRAREVLVPRRTSPETKIRQGYRSLMEAGVTTDEAAKALRKDVLTLGEYTPQSNDRLVEKAHKKRGEIGSLAEAVGAVRAYAESTSLLNMDSRIAFAEIVFAEANKAGYIDAVRQVGADLSLMASDAGRHLQAMQILKRLDSQGQIIHKMRAVERINKQIEKTAKNSKQGKGMRLDEQRISDMEKSIDAMEKINKLQARLSELSEKNKGISRDNTEAWEEVRRLNADIVKEQNKLRKLKGRHAEVMEQLTKRREVLERELKRRDLTREELSNVRRQLRAIEKRIESVRSGEMQSALDLDSVRSELEQRKSELEEAIVKRDGTKGELDKARRELADVSAKLRRALRDEYTDFWKIVTVNMDIETTTREAAAAGQSADAIRDARNALEGYKKRLDKHGWKVTIPDANIQEFLDAGKITDETARETALSVAEDNLAMAVADQIPSTVWDKIDAWRHFSMLGNPRTNIRNLVGNVTMYAARNVKDFIGAGIEGVRSLRNPDAERSKSIINPASASDRALIKFAKQDFQSNKKQLMASGKYEFGDMVNAYRRIFKTGFVERGRMASMAPLEVVDSWFVSGSYVETMAQYLKANKINPDTISAEQLTKAQTWASEQAWKATFRDTNALATFLNRLERTNAAWRVAIGGVIPYKKTPFNVLRRGVDYSPVGLVKGLTHDMLSLKRGEVSAVQAIDNISAGLSGTALVALGAFLTLKNVLVFGADNDDPDRKRRVDEMGGAQDYSLQFGDGSSYTIEWLAPMSMPLFIGSQIVRTWNGEYAGENIFPSLLDALYGLADPWLEMSMMQGVQRALRSYADNPGESIGDMAVSIATGYAGQLVPTFAGQIARAVDPVRRSTTAPADSPVTPEVERFGRQQLAKTPGASKSLEPMVDIHGEEVKNQGDTFITRLLLNMFSPGYYRPNAQTAEDKEMLRLYEMTGDTSALPRQVPKSVTHDGTNYVLEPGEVTAYAKTIGKESARLLKELYASSAYRKMSDVEKVKATRKATDVAWESAKEEFLDERNLMDGVVYDYFMDAFEKNAYARKLMGTSNTRKVYDASKQFSGLKNDNEIRALLIKTNLTQTEKKLLYNRIVTSSENDKIDAIMATGISFNEYLRIRNKQYDINQTDQTAGKKATEFASWLEDQTLKASQVSVIKDNMAFWQQNKGNSDQFDGLIEAGLSNANAYSLSQAFWELEAEEGYSDVRPIQRMEAILDSEIPQTQKDSLIRDMLNSDNRTEQFDALKAAGLSTDAIIRLNRKYDDRIYTEAKNIPRVLRSGMDVDAYLRARQAMSKISGVKDKSGKTVTGSERWNRLVEINKPEYGFTTAQKNLIYDLMEYAASTKGNVPWR